MYSNDGAELSLATTALVYKDLLLASTIDGNMLLCKLIYYSLKSLGITMFNSLFSQINQSLHTLLIVRPLQHGLVIRNKDRTPFGAVCSLFASV